MWPSLSEKGIQKAAEVLRSGKVNYWTGPLGMEFEKKWAEWNGAKFGISTSNGTSALHTAVASLGIGPGDEVICPSLTFVATANAIRYAGATPVFVDVEPDTGNLDVAAARAVTLDTLGAILAGSRLTENARLADLQKGQPMLQEEVTEEDIAKVVAHWTGVPVSRLLESETQKLLKMEERLGERVQRFEGPVQLKAHPSRFHQH